MGLHLYEPHRRLAQQISSLCNTVIFPHRLLHNETYQSRLFIFLLCDKGFLTLPVNSIEDPGVPIKTQFAFFAVNVPLCADEQYLWIRPICNPASILKQTSWK